MEMLLELLGEFLLDLLKGVFIALIANELRMWCYKLFKPAANKN